MLFFKVSLFIQSWKQRQFDYQNTKLQSAPLKLEYKILDKILDELHVLQCEEFITRVCFRVIDRVRQVCRFPDGRSIRRR